MSDKLSPKQLNTFEEPSQKKIKKDLWFVNQDGYFSLPRVVRYDRRISNSEFRVLVAIASFVFQDNSVFPSRDAIKNCTGITPSNISRATKNLEKYGWIVKTDRPHNSVLYELRIPKEFQKAKA